MITGYKWCYPASHSLKVLPNSDFCFSVACVIVLNSPTNVQYSNKLHSTDKLLNIKKQGDPIKDCLMLTVTFQGGPIAHSTIHKQLALLTFWSQILFLFRTSDCLLSWVSTSCMHHESKTSLWASFYSLQPSISLLTDQDTGRESPCGDGCPKQHSTTWSQTLTLSSPG